MRTDLLKTLPEMSDEEREAEVVRFFDGDGAWFDDLDAFKSTYDAVRAGLVDPNLSVIDREAAIGTCNYIEKVGVMAHAVIAMGLKNMEALRGQLRMAGCAFCDWKYTAEDVNALTGGLNREFTKEEIQSVHDGVGVAIRQHIVVCPNHPMRGLEQELSACRAGAPAKTGP